MSREPTAAVGGMRTVTVRDRFLAWVVTGPVGRLVAFAIDFASALLRGAVNKLQRR